ncbi:hypothetical protein E1176_15470 [Fulvivirga sp. RKSG066]|uniref:hypothetical protein n=1 Tax=Fulvivirga aurantia TaxID=2529383 RepID=UPI0012BC7E56|nr:hypothetical protein [Fulvivirga aurantia]MTI22431.1 hypothetical protein [Fulvivirga aurantia]
MSKLLKLLPFILLLITTKGFAQFDEPTEGSDWKDRVFVGGGLGLQFGTITNIEVSPLVGYRVTDNFSAGLGITYSYYKIEFNNGEEFETNIYGGRLFARRSLTDQFFLQAEYESLNLEYFNPFDNTFQREWVPGLFLGGGYFMPLSRNVGLSAIALYNALYDDLKSPYNSPLVIRFGFTAGF